MDEKLDLILAEIRALKLEIELLKLKQQTEAPVVENWRYVPYQPYVPYYPTITF